MEDVLGGLCDLLSGLWDFFSGLSDWSPVDAIDVVDTVVDFLPDGDASSARPPNRQNGQPDDGMIDW